MNIDLLQDCLLVRLSEKVDLSAFDCGNDDLNDFLQNKALKYAQQLLGVTYLFVLSHNTTEIVSFFTLSNDSLKTDTQPSRSKRLLNKKIPYPKQLRTYPAVKIGRLGTNKAYQNSGIGTQMMNFVKIWFVSENKTGCRFLTVDAYNESSVLRYYEKTISNISSQKKVKSSSTQVVLYALALCFLI